MAAGGPSLLSLPNELLDHIAGNLSTKPGSKTSDDFRHYQSFGLVCRRFHNVALPFMYGRVSLSRHDKAVRFFRKLQSEYPQRTRYIKSLTLRDCNITLDSPDSKAELDGLHLLTNLRKLKVEQTNANDFFALLPKRNDIFPSLEKFIILPHTGQRRVDLCSLLRVWACPRLRHLVISQMIVQLNDKDDALSNLSSFTNLPSLNYFEMESCEFDDGVVDILHSIRSANTLQYTNELSDTKHTHFAQFQPFETNVNSLTYKSALPRSIMSNFDENKPLSPDLRDFSKLRSLDIDLTAMCHLGELEHERAKLVSAPEAYRREKLELVRLPPTVEHLRLRFCIGLLARDVFADLVASLLEHRHVLIPRLKTLEVNVEPRYCECVHVPINLDDVARRDDTVQENQRSDREQYAKIGEDCLREYWGEGESGADELRMLEEQCADAGVGFSAVGCHEWYAQMWP